jgi:hypothetical protein
MGYREELDELETGVTNAPLASVSFLQQYYQIKRSQYSPILINQLNGNNRKVSERWHSKQKPAIKIKAVHNQGQQVRDTLGPPRRNVLGTIKA